MYTLTVSYTNLIVHILYVCTTTIVWYLHCYSVSLMQVMWHACIYSTYIYTHTHNTFQSSVNSMCSTVLLSLRFGILRGYVGGTFTARPNITWWKWIHGWSYCTLHFDIHFLISHMKTSPFNLVHWSEDINMRCKIWVKCLKRIIYAVLQRLVQDVIRLWITVQSESSWMAKVPRVSKCGFMGSCWKHTSGSS